MPEVDEQQIGAEILLARGDQMTRGHVVTQSCNAHGNIMGRAHENPVMDTRLYQVELTTNNIAKSMYSQCNADGN